MTTTNQKLTKEERKAIAYEEYEKSRAPAWKEYEKIINPALKEYEKIRKLAWKEYEKKCKEIDDEPEEVEKIKIIDGRKYKLVEEQSSGGLTTK